MGDGARFVGREHELHRLDTVLTAAPAGAGQLVVVSGEAGIGKTQFAAAATRQAARSGFATVIGRGWLGQGAPALWPWQPILAQLCGPDAAALLDGDPGRSAVDPERFARFEAVVEHLARAGVATPALVVIDDIHATDPGTVLLARFVARSLHRLRLVLMVTRRSGEPEVGSELERLLVDLEAEAMLMALGHLDLQETTALLEAEGAGPVESDLALTALRVTGGNPLFLRNLVALGPGGGGYELTGGLRRAIAQTVDRLDAADRAVLATGAVLGSQPTVAETAALSGRSPAAVLDAVDRAERAGLVGEERPGRYGFAHELVREALAATMSPADRLDTNARAAALIGERDTDTDPDSLIRRAGHALAAAPRSAVDAGEAVEACRDAARLLIRRFAYERAADLLAEAVDLHDSGLVGPPPATLLVERAQAVLQAGRLAEARSLFDRAATAASGTGDSTLLAEAALGLGGVWVAEHRDPVEHHRVLDIQQRALALLPAGAERLRLRLEMRLAAESVFDGAPIDEALEALDAVRRLGDDSALAEALSLCHHVMLTPEHTWRRLPLADELIGVASAGGEGVLALFGLCWRAVDLYALGDPRADRALAELRTRVDALGCRSLEYIVGVMDVMGLIRAGRLDDAEATAELCYHLGSEVGDADSLGYLSAHLFTIRWLQGRAAEVVDAADEVASSPTISAAAAFTFRAAAAAMAAHAGDHRRAQAHLDILAADGLHRIPPSSTWLTGMRLIVDTAHVLGDEAIARAAYRLILPYADLPVMSSLAVVDHGSVEAVLGSTAATFGDFDLAVHHLERAVAADRRLGNRPFGVIAQATLARTLRRRARTGDRERASVLLAEARAEAEAMGMGLAAAEEPDDDARTAALVHEGRHWTITVGERSAVVADMVGMDYLARLLAQPGVEIPVLTLAGADHALAGSSRQPVLDDAARTAYRHRARELSGDLEEAEANADLHRAERLRLEFDALTDELRRAAGLGGRATAFAGPRERARTSVRKAIKRAIDEISGADPVVGHLLRQTVRTGTSCCYQPDQDAPAAWQTSGATVMAEH